MCCTCISIYSYGTVCCTCISIYSYGTVCCTCISIYSFILVYLLCLLCSSEFYVFFVVHFNVIIQYHHHHHHKYQGLDSLIRSVSRVTAARANGSSVFQLFSFFVVCSEMIQYKPRKCTFPKLIVQFLFFYVFCMFQILT